MAAKSAANSDPDASSLIAPVRGDAQMLVLWLLTGYFALILICSLWLHFGPDIMARGQELSLDRAVFLSVSTATLTGFQQAMGPNEFKSDSVQGPWVLIILTVAGSLFVMITSGLASVRVLRLPLNDMHVIVAAVEGEALAVLAGTAVIFTAHGGMLHAALQSACAFGNSGSVITSNDHFLPFTAWESQCVLLPLAVLGGLGLPVLMELYNRMLGGRRPLSVHTRTVVTLSAAVYLGATLLLFISTFFAHDAAAGGARSAFAAASTMAINSRTAGLPFEILHRFSGTGQWLIVLLMMIGASPAGNGGGIKATTFWHLFIGIRNFLAGRPVPRVVGVAAIWIGGYAVLAAVSFVLLSAVVPQMESSRLAFVTISALSNVGLSHDPISIVGGGLFLLDLVMLLGRLTPLAILWWMATTTDNVQVLVA